MKKVTETLKFHENVLCASLELLPQGPQDKLSAGIRKAYLRVVGFEVDSGGPGRASQMPLTPQEEEKLRQLASRPDIYEVIAKSIAPSIFGGLGMCVPVCVCTCAGNLFVCTDIKKAISCLLFGGSRKRLPDGLTRRGDINLLLLGDPGTAKSQLLKFVEKVSPIGVSFLFLSFLLPQTCTYHRDQVRCRWSQLFFPRRSTHQARAVVQLVSRPPSSEIRHR